MSDDDYVDPIFEDDVDAPPSDPGPARPTPATPDPLAGPRQPAPRQPEEPEDRTVEMPAAQLPTEEVQRTASVTAPTPRVPRPDDIVCGSCSLSNPRERTFCERCGSVLSAASPVAPEPVELSWWQRFTRWLRRLGRGGARGRARSASRGTRVAYRRGLSMKNQVMRVLGLLGLIAGGMFALNIGPLGDLRTELFDRVSKEVVEVQAESTTALPAEAELSRWPAAEVNDGRSNTAWGTRWDETNSVATNCGVDSSAASRLRLTFPATKIDRLEMTIGLPDQNFENTARPSQVGLVFSGSSQCFVVSLEDTPDEQRLEVSPGTAQSVEVWVLGVVSDGADDPTLVLVSELEVFGEE